MNDRKIPEHIRILLDSEIEIDYFTRSKNILLGKYTMGFDVFPTLVFGPEKDGELLSYFKRNDSKKYKVECYKPAKDSQLVFLTNGKDIQKFLMFSEHERMRKYCSEYETFPFDRLAYLHKKKRQAEYF